MMLLFARYDERFSVTVEVSDVVVSHLVEVPYTSEKLVARLPFFLVSFLANRLGRFCNSKSEVLYK